MARVNWQGTEIQAVLISELPDGRYRMRSQGHAPRVEPGTIIDVEQSQIVGLNVGNATFLGPGAPNAAAPAPPIVLTRVDVLPLAASLQSATASTAVLPPAPTPVAANDAGAIIPAPSNEAAKINTEPQTITAADVGPLPAALLAPAAPQPKEKTMGTPLVEIKGLGNAITSVRSGLAGVRALAADVQVSAGQLHAELTDIKGQIEDARTQIKTEASIMGNSAGT